jgi:hypothetical protein
MEEIPEITKPPFREKGLGLGLGLGRNLEILEFRS